MAKIPIARFCRIPEDTLRDENLTFSDFKVYASMALYCINTNLVMVGQNELAKITGISRRSLRRSLDNLARRGHISRAIGRISRRTVYQLNSPVFLVTSESTAAQPYKVTPIRLVSKPKTAKS